jgi:hypothetical protein
MAMRPVTTQAIPKRTWIATTVRKARETDGTSIPATMVVSPVNLISASDSLGTVPDSASIISLLRRLGFEEIGVHRRHGRLDDVWRDCGSFERFFD